MNKESKKRKLLGQGHFFDKVFCIEMHYVVIYKFHRIQYVQIYSIKDGIRVAYGCKTHRYVLFYDSAHEYFFLCLDIFISTLLKEMFLLILFFFLLVKYSLLTFLIDLILLTPLCFLCIFLRPCLDVNCPP